MRFLNYQQDFLAKQVLNKKLGLRLKNLALDLTEQLDNSRLKNWSRAVLDWIYPPLVGAGVRIRFLDSEKIEISLPNRDRNCNENGQLDEGLICTTAAYAFKLLWRQALSSQEVRIQLSSLSMQVLSDLQGSVGIRMALPEALRESAFAELAQSGRSRLELTAELFNQDQQLLGQVQLNFELKGPTWK